MKKSAIVVAALATGCLFGGKAPPLELRYFSADTAAVAPSPRPAVAHAKLRLGAITASAHLRYRIVHRSSPVERELFDTLRWTETPDAYVRRSLTRALFDNQPLDQATAAAPTLDVEVLAFDDVERAGLHFGRVELAYQLAGETEVIAGGVVAEERPAAGAAIEQVVLAITAAMEAATETVAERVTAKLCP